MVYLINENSTNESQGSTSWTHIIQISSLECFSNTIIIISLALFLYYAISVTYSIIKAFRLYIFSQIWKRPLKKYGKWALITGSTDGIGLAFAKNLARRGFSIIVVGRNKNKLAKTKSDLENEQNVGQILTLKIDLSDSSEKNYEQVKNIIVSDNMDIGILINNAGMAPDLIGPFHKQAENLDRELTNVNVLSTVLFTRMVLPGMLKRERGLIVNISSVMGLYEPANLHNYPNSKAFINSFSSTLRLEYRSTPIHIVNLTPGFISTKLTTAFCKREIVVNPNTLVPSPDDWTKTVLNAIPTGITDFSGCLTHEIYNYVMIVGARIGIYDPIFNFFMKKYSTNCQIIS